MLRINRINSFALGFTTVLCLTGQAYGHGAWLDAPTIDFTPETEAQIQANIAAGNSAIDTNDIVELIATFDTITDGTVSGPGGYFTFYIPNGTQVVGASVVNAALDDIDVREATSPVTGEGMARGWGPKGQITFATGATGWNPPTLPAECTLYGYTAATCNSGMAYIYGDTGIFYSSRADTAFYTGDGTDLASLTNGYRIKPSNNKPWPSIGGGGDARVHNKWDAVQSNAFGSDGPLSNGFSVAEETKLAGGRGSTPYRAGSPVAGPDSGWNLDRYGTTGPWNRINYGGACRAGLLPDGPANNEGSVEPQPQNGNSNSISVCTPDGSGVLLTETTPLPLTTNAVRYAIGGIHAGETYRIKIRLKAWDPTLIKAFNAEAAGGDSTQGVKDGNDNPWRYWVGGPGVAAPSIANRLSIAKTIVAVNGVTYNDSGIIPENATVRYRIGYGNAGLSPQTNVVLSDILPSQTTGTSNFVVISGEDITPTTNPTGGTFSFPTIATLPAGGGGGIEFDVMMTSTEGQTVTNVAEIVSDDAPTPITDDAVADVVAVNADLVAAKNVSVYDPNNLGLYNVPGVDVNYEISVTNRGDSVDPETIILTDALPANLSFRLEAYDGTETEPVKFNDGAGAAASGLTCCDSTHISYSTDGGATYAYMAPAGGYDDTITHVRIKPEGTMNTGDPTNTEFSVAFRMLIE